MVLSIAPSVHRQRSVSDHPRFYVFYATVVAVQGVHVIEHIVQLLQVYVFGVPSEEAFGLLGYVVNFNRTAEWLHLGFNSLYLLSLFVLVLGVHELALAGQVSMRAFRVFLVLGVGLETWHMTEHVVIIYHVVQNHGCPCPGIGDQALNVSDIQLHFVYNAVTYASTVAPFVLWTRHRRHRAGALIDSISGPGAPRPRAGE